MKKRTLTIYEATDGRQFSSKSKCLKYEKAGCVEFEPIPKGVDHFPLTDQELNWMTRGDGDCYYATATKITRIRPRHPHPSWATHLVYFGK